MINDKTICSYRCASSFGDNGYSPDLRIAPLDLSLWHFRGNSAPPILVHDFPGPGILALNPLSHSPSQSSYVVLSKCTPQAAISLTLPTEEVCPLIRQGIRYGVIFASPSRCRSWWFDGLPQG
ncbi:hypothetical protein PTI98_006755 [Pleurotus ostreatus]|nr:hypothetical protein PTI98_006755 [Pleurotus ostreatus]